VRLFVGNLDDESEGKRI